ncbi:MAG: hypothetical protein Q8S32_06815 [Burkholderiaceae bacterium]|nr:hypothetical protein [Burkholderiaceae bacterium]
MCIESGSRAVVVRRAVVVAALLGGAWLGSAQAQLSSPIGQGSGQASIPGGGQGAGTHSLSSPFAKLPPRDDVVPWSVLTAVRSQTVGRRVLPLFSPEVLAMHGSKRRVQGFMTPLAPGALQSHFLVSSVPLTCSFCIPGGPESMLEVRTPQPVKYSLEGVVVQGTLQVLADDPSGLFYRMTDAVLVK